MSAGDGHINLFSLLPDSLEEKELWEPMFEEISKFFNDILEAKAAPFVQARDVHYLEREVLSHHLRQKGVDWNVSDLTDDEMRKIARTINKHWPERYVMAFVKFMGYVKNSKMRLYPLWTKDYDAFFIGEFNGQRVYQGGEYYPTTHVGLGYSPISGTPLSDESLTELFYTMAPINLVLKWIALLDEAVVDCIVVAGQGREKSIDHGVAQENFAKAIYYKAQGREKGLDYGQAENVLDPDYMSGTLSTQLSVSQASASPARMVDGKYGIVGDGWEYVRNSSALFFRTDGLMEYYGPHVPRLKCCKPGGTTPVGLLMERQTQNALSQSTDMEGTTWIKTNGLTADNNAGSPSRWIGQPNSNQVVDGSAVISGYLAHRFAVGNNVDYVVSGYVGPQTDYPAMVVRWGQIGNVLNKVAGVYCSAAGTILPVSADTGTYGSISLGGGWYWIWFTYKPTGNPLMLAQFELYPAWGNSTTLSATRQGAWDIMGFQHEPGVRPTTLIKTLGASGRDKDSYIGPKTVRKVFNEPGYAYLAYERMFPNIGEGALWQSGRLADYVVAQERDGQILSSFRAGLMQATATANSVSGKNRLLVAWDGDTWRQFVNGVKILSTTPAFLMDPPNFDLGSDNDVQDGLDGWLEMFQCANYFLNDVNAAAFDLV